MVSSFICSVHPWFNLCFWISTIYGFLIYLQYTSMVRSMIVNSRKLSSQIPLTIIQEPNSFGRVSLFLLNNFESWVAITSSCLNSVPTLKMVPVHAPAFSLGRPAGHNFAFQILNSTTTLSVHIPVVCLQVFHFLDTSTVAFPFQKSS